MKNVVKVLKEIEATSSRGGKEQILKDNKDSELLKKVLWFAFNPYIITGISDKKMQKGKDNYIKNDATVINNIYELMDYLEKNNTGRDIDIKNVLDFIYSQSKELQELYEKIVTKNVIIGITEKTINKVWKGLIPTFEIMLAKKYFDYEDKIKGKFIVSKKLDGVRCVIIKENGNIKMVSRQGKLFEGFDQLLDDAKKLPDGFVYDGELLLKNDKCLSSKDLYRATMKEVSKDGEKFNIQFHMFDALPIEEFKNGTSKRTCYDRKCFIQSVLNAISFSWIVEVPILYCGTDKNMIIILLNKVIESGEEGVMVNLSDRLYECKRTDAILKVKKMQDCDIRIIGFEEGEGKFKGTLGATIVDYKGFKVKVGSGYSDFDRSYIWKNKENLINRVMKVQYFEESSNQDGGLSLRFPVFLEIREDGKEVSYN